MTCSACFGSRSARSVLSAQRHPLTAAPRYSEFQFSRAAQATGRALEAMAYISKQYANDFSTYSTAFSGVDAPGVAFKIAKFNLEVMCGLKLPEPKHLAAVEKYRPSIQELQIHPSAPKCLYTNVTEFWRPAVRPKIEAMKSSKQAWNRDTFLPLIKKGPGACNDKCAAFCIQHNKQCPCPKAAIHIAGIECRNWSPRGDGSGESGDSMESFSVT